MNERDEEKDKSLKAFYFFPSCIKHTLSSAKVLPLVPNAKLTFVTQPKYFKDGQH